MTGLRLNRHGEDGVLKILDTYHTHPGQRGFTLLALLVVVAVLAATAFIASGTFRGVSDDADERLVRAEMQEIAKALRQFRQDTGYFPRQGPFALNTAASAPNDESVIDADLQTVAHSGGTAAARARWFNSPANFYQLLVDPLLSDHVQGLEQWNAETGRGWRGPYLSGFRDGFVDIGDEINPDQLGENGDPTTVVVAAIPDVNGLADPFLAPPVPGGEATVNNNLLDWASLVHANPNRVPLSRWGGPYLFLQIGGRWSLVSMGPNGKYDQGGGDDLVLPLE